MENQVNALIEPYKNFVHPIMSLLTFLLFSFYASLAHIIYILTVDILFLLAKKTGFYKVETIQVEQEQLTF